MAFEPDLAKKSDLVPLQQAADTANQQVVQAEQAHFALAQAASAAKVKADAADAAAVVAKTAADTAQELANTANSKAISGISRDDMAKSNLPSQPRVRVEKSTSMTLNTTWQRVAFNDANALNVNTFPMMEETANQTVKWDATNKLFMFGASEDRNYTLDLYLVVNNTNVLNVLTGNTMVKIQYRLAVPNGISPGVPFTFPFPGSNGADGYAEVGLTTSLLASQRLKISENIYAAQTIRTNGLGVELRLSGMPPLGSISCALAICILYGR